MMKFKLLSTILLASCMYIYSAIVLTKDNNDKNIRSVKSQIKNQVCIDSKNFTELLEKKKISVDALKKTIIDEFPIEKIENVVVRAGKDLCDQEKLYRKNRSLKVAKILRENFEINKPLTIGFSFSGGGNRAMIGTLGILKAAAKHKFLDASMYLAGLSGSTWIIASWSYLYLKRLLSQDLETSICEYEEMLIDALDYPCSTKANACFPNDLDQDIKMSFAYNLAKHFAYDQRITIVDLYGAFIANYALKKAGKDRLNILWSSMANDIQKGSIPLPICSAVIDVNVTSDKEYSFGNPDFKWFETGPFEAGSTALGFVPIWAFGSTFKNGKILFNAPENEMSLYFGVYGSAFGLSKIDFMDPEVLQPTFKVSGVDIALPMNLWMKKLIDMANKDNHEKNSRNIYAKFANYSNGLSFSMLPNVDQFGLLDGGEFFHNPLPLLFDRPKRSVDVAIVYDSYPGRSQSLIDAFRYFKKEGVIIPDLEKALNSFGSTKEAQQAGLLSKSMTVFNDPREKSYDKYKPTLIYFPTPQTDISKIPFNIDVTKYPDVSIPIDNSKRPYLTQNFKYSKDEFKNLSGTMMAIFESQIDEMKSILKLISEKKDKLAL